MSYFLDGAIVKVLFPKKEVLEDWEDCGELGDLNSTYSKSDSKCLWDCEWIENKYHKFSFPWDLFEEYKDEITGSKCHIIQPVVYYTSCVLHHSPKSSKEPKMS